MDLPHLLIIDLHDSHYFCPASESPFGQLNYYQGNSYQSLPVRAIPLAVRAIISNEFQV